MKQHNNEKYSILIVDDVSKNIQVVANLLNEEGYKMAFAQSGKTALDIIKEHTIDLVLLDIMMPEMDGYEVCRILKENAETTDIPIIFITAKTDTDSIVKGFEAGGVDYITKPFHGKELISRVRTHLRLHSTEKELLKKNEQLKLTNITKDKFFSIIAHDLKNPFSALMGYTSIITEDIDTIGKDELLKYVGNMERTVKNAYSLLENLLQWSRSQTGRLDFHPFEIDLYLIAIRNIGLLTSAADNKQIALVNNIKKGTEVYVDENMISTVIRNLLSNAIKFSHKGGEVILDMEEKNGEVLVSVKDNGVGISKEDRDKLFRIDVSLSTVGTAEEKGTGLGLILCKEFVEKHNGEIRVDSEPGKGSTFSFIIPKSKPA